MSYPVEEAMPGPWLGLGTMAMRGKGDPWLWKDNTVDILGFTGKMIHQRIGLVFRQNHMPKTGAAQQTLIRRWLGSSDLDVTAGPLGQITQSGLLPLL